MIIAYSTELKNAFIEHSKNYKENTSSHYLLLFYAVECGLKYLIVSRNGRKAESSNTSESNNRDYPKFATHELNELLKYCNYPKSYNVDSCKSQRGSNEQIHVQDIHTAWRYGIELKSDEQNKAIGALSKIRQDIHKKLNEGFILKTKYTR